MAVPCKVSQHFLTFKSTVPFSKCGCFFGVATLKNVKTDVTQSGSRCGLSLPVLLPHRTPCKELGTDPVFFYALQPYWCQTQPHFLGGRCPAKSSCAVRSHWMPQREFPSASGLLFRFYEPVLGRPREAICPFSLLPRGRMERNQRRNSGMTANWWNLFSMKQRFLTLIRMTSRTFFIWSPSCFPSETGFIPKKNLTVSWDRTAVAVHMNPFGCKPKHPKNPAQSISGMWHYSDPDAEWG